MATTTYLKDDSKIYFLNSNNIAQELNEIEGDGRIKYNAIPSLSLLNTLYSDLSADDKYLSGQISGYTTTNDDKIEFLSTAIDEKLSVIYKDGSIPATNKLSVVNVTNEQYDSLATGSDPNILYVIKDSFINARNQQIKNIGAPVDDNDAASKKYIDTSIATNTSEIEHTVEEKYETIDNANSTYSKYDDFDFEYDNTEKKLRLTLRNVKNEHAIKDIDINKIFGGALIHKIEVVKTDSSDLPVLRIYWSDDNSNSIDVPITYIMQLYRGDNHILLDSSADGYTISLDDTAVDAIERVYEGGTYIKIEENSNPADKQHYKFDLTDTAVSVITREYKANSGLTLIKDGTTFTYSIDSDTLKAINTTYGAATGDPWITVSRVDESTSITPHYAIDLDKKYKDTISSIQNTVDNLDKTYLKSTDKYKVISENDNITVTADDVNKQYILNISKDLKDKISEKLVDSDHISVSTVENNTSFILKTAVLDKLNKQYKVFPSGSRLTATIDDNTTYFDINDDTQKKIDHQYTVDTDTLTATIEDNTTRFNINAATQKKINHQYAADGVTLSAIYDDSTNTTTFKLHSDLKTAIDNIPTDAVTMSDLTSYALSVDVQSHINDMTKYQSEINGKVNSLADLFNTTFIDAASRLGKCENDLTTAQANITTVQGNIETIQNEYVKKSDVIEALDDQLANSFDEWIETNTSADDQIRSLYDCLDKIRQICKS